MENNDNRQACKSGDGEANEHATKTNEVDRPSEAEVSVEGGGSGGGGGESQGPEGAAEQPLQSSSRTPFTNLSQIDADLALARRLQEQERAYMMLSMNNDLSDYGSWETGSYSDEDDDDFDDPDNDNEMDDGDENGDEDGDASHQEEDENDVPVGTDVGHEEDAFDVHAHEEGEDDDSADVEIEPGAYTSDEAYARALQEAEERDMTARLFALAGLSDRVEHAEDHSHDLQDAWEEVDPDELSYEELLALGEVVGTESRGLSADTISSLPSMSYKAGSTQNGTNESCVICRLDYEDGDELIVLSCKHSYHSECINNWLKINKVCPVCSTEVSTSGHS